MKTFKIVAGVVLGLCAVAGTVYGAVKLSEKLKEKYLIVEEGDPIAEIACQETAAE